MKQIKYLLILLSINFSATGCKKLVEADMPSDRLALPAVFSNDATAIAAISGMYAQMYRVSSQFGAMGTTLFAGLSADELYYNSTAPLYMEFANNDIATNNPVLRSNLWTSPYQLVFHANNILEGLEMSTGVTAATKKQLQGEAKFIRALSHFYLVNMFGDVPVVLTTNYEENRTLPRMPRGKVYEQIITDLQSAKDLLQTTYPAANRIRPN